MGNDDFTRVHTLIDGALVARFGTVVLLQDVEFYAVNEDVISPCRPNPRGAIAVVRIL
jgi:hypothetical protein